MKGGQKNVEQKLKEIQRKVVYMRAQSPPRSLLHSTTRHETSGRTSPSSLADVLADDGVYEHLKSTFKNSSRSIHSSSTSSNSPVSITRQLSSSYSSSGPESSSPTARDTASVGQMSAALVLQHSPAPTHSTHSSTHTSTTTAPLPTTTTSATEDYSKNPLVGQLSHRGLTTPTRKRKLQAHVRREVNTMLLLNGN